MRHGWSGCAGSFTLEHGAFQDNIFAFWGRRGDLIKILWWSGDGMNLYAECLERGRFIQPRTNSGNVHFSAAQLSMLREGYDGG